MGADTRSEEEMEEIAGTVEDKLKKLGNIIGDVLLLIEQEAIGTGKDSFIKKRITTLIDIYAEEFDKILIKHGIGMGSEMKKLVTSLLDDLEKLTNSEMVWINFNVKLKKANIIQTK